MDRDGCPAPVRAGGGACRRGCVPRARGAPTDGVSSVLDGGGAAPPPAAEKADPPDVLDRLTCLEALAALRHAKWFQVCPPSLPPPHAIAATAANHRRTHTTGR